MIQLYLRIISSNCRNIQLVFALDSPVSHTNPFVTSLSTMLLIGASIIICEFPPLRFIPLEDTVEIWDSVYLRFLPDTWKPRYCILSLEMLVILVFSSCNISPNLLSRNSFTSFLIFSANSLVPVTPITQSSAYLL